MAFERWQQQLFDLLTAVHTKRYHYDQAAQACQLLLRPWPKKSQENEEAAKKYHQKNNENGKVVDHQEEAELKLVNELLSKAQRTRVKLLSKKPKEDAKQTEDELATGRSEKQLWEICDSDPANAPEKNVNASHHAPAQSAYPRAVPVIEPDDGVGQKVGGSACSENTTSSTHRMQHPKLRTVKAGGGQSSARCSGPVKKAQPSVSNLRKPTLITDVKRPKSLESAQSSQPPARPRSGLAKVKPPHTTAPFRTDPNLHFPKRQAKKPVAAVPLRNSQKGHVHSGDYKCQNKVLPPISSERDQSSSCSPDAEDDAALPDTCDNTPTSVIDEEVRTRVEFSSRPKLNGELVSLEMSDLIPSYEPVKDTGSIPSDAKPVNTLNLSDKQEGKQDTPLFSLLADGQSLTIPSKVRRAFAKNQQLRNKVLQRDAQRKLGSESCNRGQEFVNKLQELFDTEEELLYRQQALECLHTHRNLAKLLQHLDLNHLTDASSPYDILRAKVMAEFVLSSFSLYSEDASLLSKVQFPVRASVTEPSHRPVRLHHMWLPHYLQGKDLCLPQTKLRYTSAVELHIYLDLLLNIQTLQCQRHLLSVLVADTLPWLEKLDCGHNGFGAVFRGIFSLLVADGKHLPALICDS